MNVVQCNHALKRLTHHSPEEGEDGLERPGRARAAAVPAVGEEHAAHVPRRVRLPPHHEHREQQNLWSLRKLLPGDIISSHSTVKEICEWCKGASIYDVRTEGGGG